MNRPARFFVVVQVQAASYAAPRVKRRAKAPAASLLRDRRARFRHCVNRYKINAEKPKLSSPLDDHRNNLLDAFCWRSSSLGS
mmetsp:Transcript_125990/g.199709  ORF Transcript_125990/g.199709 Transcript_125990/m.199709 type:complete len:83 (-) Transcript_125990:62-310(-)